MKFLEKKDKYYTNLLKIFFLFNILLIIISWVLFNFEYFKIISLLNITLGFLFITFYLENNRKHIPVPEVLFFTFSIGFSFFPSIGLNTNYAEFLSIKGIFVHAQFYENFLNPSFQLKVQFYILIILLSSLIIWEFLLKNLKFKYNFLSYDKNFKFNFWKYIFWINIFVLIFFNLLGHNNFNFFQNIILIIGNYYFFIIKNKYRYYYFILTIVVALLYFVIISFVLSLILVFVVSLKKRDRIIIFFAILSTILCIFLKSEITNFRSALSSGNSDYLNERLENQYQKRYSQNDVLKNKEKYNDAISQLFNSGKKIELILDDKKNGLSENNKNKLYEMKKYEIYLDHYIQKQNQGINKVLILPARFDYSYITARILRLKEIDGIEKSYGNFLPLLSKFKIDKFENYHENFTNYIGRQLQIFDGLDRYSSLNLTFVNSLFYSFENFAIVLVIILLIMNSILALIILKNFENNYEIFFIIVPLLMWEKNFSLYYGDVIKGSMVFLFFFLIKKIIQNIYFFQNYFD